MAPPTRRVRLATPRLEIVLTEDDAEALIVQTINADMVLAERTARKHNWGSIGDAPIASQTFLAWAALRRRKLLPDPGMSFEAFEATCVSIQAAPDDPADPDADAASPTGPALVPG